MSSRQGRLPRGRRLEDSVFKGGLVGIALVGLATLTLVVAAALIAAVVAAIF